MTKCLDDRLTRWLDDRMTGSFADDWPYGIFINIITICIQTLNVSNLKLSESEETFVLSVPSLYFLFCLWKKVVKCSSLIPWNPKIMVICSYSWRKWEWHSGFRPFLSPGCINLSQRPSSRGGPEESKTPTTFKVWIILSQGMTLPKN